MKAVKCLEDAEEPNIAEAADLFDVTYDRLYRLLHGKVCRHNREGPNRQLSTAQEGSLCAYPAILDNLSLSP
jgi:hypothetical protein